MVLSQTPVYELLQDNSDEKSFSNAPARFATQLPINKNEHIVYLKMALSRKEKSVLTDQLYTTGTVNKQSSLPRL